MIKKDLVFCGTFVSKVKGKDTEYVISSFVDSNSLQVIYGTDLKDISSLQVGDIVTCELAPKRNKVVVTSVS